MASETASSADEETVLVSGAAAGGVGTDKRGKHRILAELKRLQQDTKFLREELEELEKTENVSAICMELLQNMDSRPDPLLPEVQGPVNLLWDRWFEGPQDPQACRCWIL
ncbi:guanine nucleotide-binding protein subunit gamma 1 [Cicer arietinum]|uniref:Guanine nucleotide-binding protein subunit gamma 2 n=1 Tax=Cicer arietinum TaxID=3827 RepID=A0A1S2XVL2_CICAR|nr:guanine nucleotide-binding protein subunit gamma 2 [Cicer arietinum]XP_004495155.1 guanine nucleotide-binding protein subunit gamma 2 [Cicer arietinum]XP_004495156.1 guanine nucleotide-binding protein subunit gamma 2 [Cicer arietinum]